MCGVHVCVVCVCECVCIYMFQLINFKIFFLKTMFGNYENSIKQLNTNQENLKKNLLDLKELKQILEKAQTFFQEGEQALAEAYVQQAVAGGGGGGGAPNVVDSKHSGKKSVALQNLCVTFLFTHKHAFTNLHMHTTYTSHMIQSYARVRIPLLLWSVDVF